MEIFDVVDEKGNPTGKTATREEAHSMGVRHRTSHVWLIRRKQGKLQVLLQKRSPEKDSFPGCYDISSAGHIPAGMDWIPSAIRELEEELGVTCAPEDLVYCGQRHNNFEREFHGRQFRDDQISNVYLLWMDKEPEEFHLQPEEVSEVVWYDFEDAYNAVMNCTIPTCIHLDELNLVRRKVLLG